MGSKKLIVMALLLASLSTYAGLNRPSLAESQYYDRAEAFAVMMDAYNDATVAKECESKPSVSVVVHDVFVRVNCETRAKALIILHEYADGYSEKTSTGLIWRKGE